MTNYEQAKERYAAFGIDTEAALEQLRQKPISIHCWQGDDVAGFDQVDGKAGDGIQTTGNYPGKARNFEELKADFLKAASMIPGKKRINLHASYAVFPEGEWADRDKIEYRHFAPWVEFAKENGFGIDFNPTCFSHPMVKDGLTLSHPDEAVRRFWIDHCKATRRIAQQIGEALGDQVLNNVWVPDGFKDIPADRMGPRMRLKASLDEVFAEKYPNVIDCVESKVFGIGLESMTVGSNEFYTAYAATHPGVYNLLDAGHYHPTEYISDKIPAMLCFFDKVPLHVTRPVRWDSDHVVLFDDEIKEIMKEVVRNDALDKVLIGLDFFDASINRIAAWVLGTRSAQKALLFALLQPNDALKTMQDEMRFTEKLVRMEEARTLPLDAVWSEYCRRQNVPEDGAWFGLVQQYEADVLSKRG
ncbi:MAG: L-rhamnose isomerase [Subdoligranulum sp.]|nr:L-rhamnose isomerase [Subdoligranulum sp.]